MDARSRHRRPGGRRRRLVTVVGSAVAAFALLAPAASAASAADNRLPLAVALATPHDGIFRSTCLPSHVAMDDPIVHPNEPGASHQHEFFGNATTDADSTYASLLGKATTCRIKADTAAYWIPTLFADGDRVAPIQVNAYYLHARARGRVTAFPAGLKVVAGNSAATTPQSVAVTGWRCAGVVMALSQLPTACPAGHDNVLVVRFPQCWNGHDLDSADHKSHLAYAVRGACPAGYPVRLPQLSLNFHYRLPTTTGLTFASGSIYSAHADFFNAWNQAVLTRLVRVNLT